MNSMSKIDHNLLYDEIKRIPRCDHDFGTQRQETVGPDGKTRVVKGKCLKCGSSFPTSWVEVQNLSPYSLYLIAMALIPVIERAVASAVVDGLAGKLIEGIGPFDDQEPEEPPAPFTRPPSSPVRPPPEPSHEPR